MATSLFGVGETLNANQAGTIVPQSFVGTAGQTVFNLTNFTYTPNTNSLELYINGTLQVSGRDYIETSLSSFTLVEGVVVGDFVDVFGVVAFTPQSTIPGSIILGGTYTLNNYLNDSAISVKSFPWLATGSGTGDDSVAINAAIASAPAGSIVVVPPGTYKCLHAIVMKNNITLVGFGWGASILDLTALAQDALVIQNPINSSTLANISIEGLYIKATGLAANRGCVFDTGSTCVRFSRNFLETSAVGFGLILDQSELWDINNNYCAGGGYGIWLVNGADRNVGASTFFTNRISIQNNQLNVSKIGIVDDGGNDHFLITNNYNAGITYVRANGANGLHILGGELENCSSFGIDLQATKFSGAAGIISAVVTISKAIMTNATAIAVVNIVASAVRNLRFEGNTLNTAGTVIAGANNCQSCIAEGNFQAGAGDGITVINNRFSVQSVAVNVVAAGGGFVLGNGTLVCTISRFDRLVTVNYRLTAGTTTVFGAGNFQIDLPFNGAGLLEVGAALFQCAGGIYTGIVLTGSPANKCIFFASNNTANAVQSNVPAVWVATATNILSATVQYTALNQLG